MPTAWQILMKKLNPDPPQTKQVLNPFEAKIGSTVQLDVLDWRGNNFLVKAVRELSRNINGKNFKLVDYDLLARPIKGDDIFARLRLVPIDNAPTSKYVDVTHSCVLLVKHDELGFDQAFLDVLNDPSGEFVTQQDGEETGRYWRINDLKTPYDCVVKTIDDSNEKSETVESTGIQLWDYWREHPDETGQPTKEFFFIEMEKDSGYFTLWRGEEINPNNVNII